VYNTLPKFWNEREIKMDEKLKVQEGLKDKAEW